MHWPTRTISSDPKRGARYGLAVCAVWIAVGWVLVPATMAEQTRRERAWARDLATGAAAYDDGLHAAAQGFFEKALRRAQTAEERRESVLWLARAHYRQGAYAAVNDLMAAELAEEKQLDLQSVYRYWRARAQFALGDYAGVLTELDQIERSALARQEAGQSVRMAGRAHAACGQRAEALAYFTQYAEAYRDEPESTAANYVDAASVHLELGQADRAWAKLQQVVDTMPDTRAAQTARLWLGTDAEERGDLEAARDYLTTLIEREPARSDWAAEAGYVLARVEAETGDTTRVVEILAEAAAQARTAEVRYRGHLLQARAHFQLNEWAQGIGLLRALVEEIPDQPLAAQAQLELAEAWLDQEEYETALDAFQDYLEAFEDPVGRANAWLGRAWSLLGLRRPVEAAQAFEEAYHLHPGVMERQQALFKMGDAFFAAGNHERAREEYLLITQVFPGSTLIPRALFQAAECLARDQQIAESVQEFRALEDAFPASRYAEQAAMRIGGLQEISGEWERAIQAYSRAMVAYPEGQQQGEALLRRGLVRYRLGLFEEALADFERVVESFPDRASSEQAYYMRGWCLYLLGHGPRALAVAEDFIARYPDSQWRPTVLFWMASYHFNLGQFAEAETRFAAIAEDGAQVDAALYWAGRAAMEQEAYLRAMDYFNTLAAEFPDSPKIAATRFAQGDALTQLGEFASAILAFDEIIRRHDDADMVYRAWGRKGDCHFTLGQENPARFTEAKQAFSIIVESEHAPAPLRLQAEFKLGRCLEQMNDPVGALEHYLRVVYEYVNNVRVRGAEEAVWFTRAAFAAAAMKEANAEPEAAIRILQRVVEAGVLAAPDAQTRIERIRAEKGETENHA